MKLDVLAFAAHPDDVEISIGGTVSKLVSQGKKVGIVDLTRGELGTRGSADLRDQEAASSSKIMGLSARVNLDLGDGMFENSHENKLKIIEQIRRYRPQIIFANALSDRHPDHGRGAALVKEAAFLSGLPKIETSLDGDTQTAWRASLLAHYMQDYYHEPDFVIDVTDFFDQKMNAIKAFSSQFHDPNSKEPQTPISGEGFFEMIKARAISLGRPAGMELAEGFIVERILGVDDIFNLR